MSRETGSRMLIGLDPILGPDLLAVLRAMGHGDEIALVDGNYPAATDAGAWCGPMVWGSCRCCGPCFRFCRSTGPFSGDLPARSTPPPRIRCSRYMPRLTRCAPRWCRMWLWCPAARGLLCPGAGGPCHRRHKRAAVPRQCHLAQGRDRQLDGPLTPCRILLRQQIGKLRRRIDFDLHDRAHPAAQRAFTGSAPIALRLASRSSVSKYPKSVSPCAEDIVVADARAPKSIDHSGQISSWRRLYSSS